MHKAQRARTGDRGPPDGSPQIYTVSQIGPKRALTPNGNLICYDVPIARTGTLLYKAGEVPLKPGQDGVIRVTRTPEELFRPETIGSFMGVAVTDDHPPEAEVTPRTWKRLAYGFSTTNVRRGEDEWSDVLLADLIITDKWLIDQILNDVKVEVSAGYDADYEQVSEGEGNQTDIIGNHIALVTRGRCGPRCAIGDHDPFTKGKEMTIRKRLTSAQTLQRLRAIVGDAEALLEETADPSSATGEETDVGGTHIHIHTGSGGGGGNEPGSMPNTLTTDNPDDPNSADPNAPQGGDMETRVATIEAGMKQMAGVLAELVTAVKGKAAAPTPDANPDGGEADDPDGGDDTTKDEMPDDLKKDDVKTGDELVDGDITKAHKTGDSAALSRSYQELLADAEVLVPGFRAPTFDAKANRAKTVDRMCALRRKALDAFYTTANGKTVVDTLTGKTDIVLEDMQCGPVASLFKNAAGAQRLVNNRASTGDSHKMPEQETPKPAFTVADWNKANAEFWEKQGIPAR